jgi:DNA-binding LytR/AlgR family response regulator
MLKCMIVDDEEMAVKVIASHAQQVAGLHVAGAYYSATAAFAALRQQHIDLLFLDIQMPGMNGLSLLRSLPRQPHTILTTAHREFALESYEYNVVDYLLKPIALDRFIKSVGKVFQLAQMQQPVVAPAATAGLTEAPFIYIKSDRQFIKILLDDILYMESIKNHIKIITAAETFTTLLTITEMEERLPPQHFMRIHRSYIAAVSKIGRFTHTSLFIGTAELPIGELYKPAVLQTLNRHLI